MKGRVGAVPARTAAWMAIAGVVSVGACRVKSARSETHFIIQDYLGSVLILFEDPEGVWLNTAEQAAYSIPADGILHLRNHKPDHSGVQYFYVGPEGASTQLFPVTWPQRKVGILDRSEGTKAVSRRGKVLTLPYEFYIVGAPSDPNDLWWGL